ncbi:hypothetical protein P9362_21180, partial [Escherichia coli]
DVFAGKKSAQIREILISESAWEEMTRLFAPSLNKKLFGGCNACQTCSSSTHAYFAIKLGWNHDFPVP